MNHLLPVLLIAAFLFVQAPAHAADSINIDIGDQPSPSSTYGSASEQPGAWNGITALDTPTALVDTSGAATGASVSVTASSLRSEALAYRV